MVVELMQDSSGLEGLEVAGTAGFDEAGYSEVDDMETTGYEGAEDEAGYSGYSGALEEGLEGAEDTEEAGYSRALEVTG